MLSRYVNCASCLFMCNNSHALLCWWRYTWRNGNRVYWQLGHIHMMSVKNWAKKRARKREVSKLYQNIWGNVRLKDYYIFVSTQIAEESLPILKYIMGIILLIPRGFFCGLCRIMSREGFHIAWHMKSAHLWIGYPMGTQRSEERL